MESCGRPHTNIGGVGGSCSLEWESSREGAVLWRGYGRVSGEECLPPDSLLWGEGRREQAWCPGGSVGGMSPVAPCYNVEGSSSDRSTGLGLASGRYRAMTRQPQEHHTLSSRAQLRRGVGASQIASPARLIALLWCFVQYNPLHSMCHNPIAEENEWFYRGCEG